MKRFLTKFIIVFVLLNGYLSWYAIKIYPNLSGDIGILGQIPFGSEYTSRMDSIYPCTSRHVKNIYYDEINETESQPIFTIGDSFSAQDTLGYQQFIGESWNKTIYNILHPDNTAEELFCQLLNSAKIPEGSIVIVESVERSMIKRLNEVDIESTLPNTPITKLPEGKTDGKMNLLSGAAAKLRLALGYKKPVVQYSTTEDLFSHPTIHNQLFLFNSTWDSYDFEKDGDLLFQSIQDKSFLKAYENLAKMKQLADSKNIKFLYLIVGDKYEVYDPFIKEKHPRNPTLDNCPEELWVINTKPLLQEKALHGTKDIFRINDTHWSPIGAKIVANELEKRIAACQYL